jgi:hypothetical protein
MIDLCLGTYIVHLSHRPPYQQISTYSSSACLLVNVRFMSMFGVTPLSSRDVTPYGDCRLVEKTKRHKLPTLLTELRNEINGRSMEVLPS